MTSVPETAASREIRLLIVDDDSEIRAELGAYLSAHFFWVQTAANGEEAERLLADGAFDIILLDLWLGSENGFDVLRRLRQTRNTPCIMVTAQDEMTDKIVGLELGADDYVTKPFSIRELVARVKAVLRRARTLPKEQEHVSFGEIEVNLRNCQVSRAGKPLEFSSKEFELLKYLVCHQGETLSRDRLLEEVWGYDRFPTTRTVDTHIVHLRQKIEPKPEEPRFILTVHGTGYKFVS